MSKRLFALLGFALSLCAMSLPALADQRVTWFYGVQIPTANLNQQERAQRLSDGTWRNTILGGQSGYANLAIAPVAGLYVNVGPSNTAQDGAVYQAGIADDATSWGGGTLGPTTALAADPTQITAQGLVSSTSPNIGPLAVPSTSGQSQISLIECQVGPIDTNPTTQNYITSLGSVQTITVNRDRDDTVTCQTNSGIASTTPTVPTVDAGWVAIGYVTVPYGTATITTGMITMEPTITPIAASVLPSQLAAPQSTGQATLPGAYPYVASQGFQVTNNTALTFANPPFTYIQTDNSPEDVNGGCVPGSCDISPIVEAYAIANGHSQVNPGYFYVQGNSVNNFFTGAFSTTTTAAFTIPALCAATNVYTVSGCSLVTVHVVSGAFVGGCPGTIGISDGTHSFSGWCTASTSTTLRVAVWEYGANTSSGNTMASGATAGVGQFYVGLYAGAYGAAGSGASAIYGANIQATLGNANPGATMATTEFDNINSSAYSIPSIAYNYNDNEPHSWGVDSVSIGSNSISSDFDARFVGTSRPIDGYTCMDAVFSCYLSGGGWINQGALQMKHGFFNVWRQQATSTNNYGSVDSGYASNLYLGTLVANVTLPAIGSSVTFSVTGPITGLQAGDNVASGDGTHSFSGTITSITGSSITATVVQYLQATTFAGSIVAAGAGVEADQVWATSSSPYLSSGAGGASYYSIGLEGNPFAYVVNDSTLQVNSNLNGATPLLVGGFAVGGNHSAGQSEANLYNLVPAAATVGQPAFDFRALIGTTGSHTDTELWKLDRAGNETVTGTVTANAFQIGASGPTWTTGAGAPSGACTNGSLYTNTSGGAGTLLYGCYSSAWHAATSP